MRGDGARYCNKHGSAPATLPRACEPLPYDAGAVSQICNATQACTLHTPCCFAAPLFSPTSPPHRNVTRPTHALTCKLLSYRAGGTSAATTGIGTGIGTAIGGASVTATAIATVIAIAIGTGIATAIGTGTGGASAPGLANASATAIAIGTAPAALRSRLSRRSRGCVHSCSVFSVFIAVRRFPSLYLRLQRRRVVFVRWRPLVRTLCCSP